MTRKTMRALASHLAPRTRARQWLLLLAAVLAAVSLTVAGQPAYASQPAHPASGNVIKDHCWFASSYPSGGEADSAAMCDIQITRFEITIEVTRDGHPVWNGPPYDCHRQTECVDAPYFGSQPSGHEWCTTAWYVFQAGDFAQDATDHNCIRPDGTQLYSWFWQP